MSTITNITVQTYAYELEDFGPGGTYQRGGKIRLEKFIVSIATDDGLAGSYAFRCVPTGARPGEGHGSRVDRA